MPYTLVLLAAALTLFTSTLAFSPDQCNATSYGRPDRSACNTLLTNIGKLGTGNTSYLFIPTQFATPDGLSNGTRKNFPQTWSTSKFSAASVGVSRESNRVLTCFFCVAGCNAALVPIEEDDDGGSSASNGTSVTYDTSTYQDLATVGGVIVQQCISNRTRASGGWELAGSPPSSKSTFCPEGSGLTRFLQGIWKPSSSISTPPDPKSTRRSDSKPAPKSQRRVKMRSKRRNWMTPNIKTLYLASMMAAPTLPALLAMPRRPMDNFRLRRPTRRRWLLPRPKR